MIAVSSIFPGTVPGHLYALLHRLVKITNNGGLLVVLGRKPYGEHPRADLAREDADIIATPNECALVGEGESCVRNGPPREGNTFEGAREV
jgi:hypothetical protein